MKRSFEDAFTADPFDSPMGHVQDAAQSTPAVDAFSSAVIAPDTCNTYVPATSSDIRPMDLGHSSNTDNSASPASSLNMSTYDVITSSLPANHPSYFPSRTTNIAFEGRSAIASASLSTGANTAPATAISTTTSLVVQGSPRQGSAAQTVFGIAELREMILEHLFTDDMPLALAADDLSTLRFLNKTWYQWAKSFILKNYIQDLLFCRPGNPEGFTLHDTYNEEDELVPTIFRSAKGFVRYVQKDHVRLNPVLKEVVPLAWRLGFFDLQMFPTLVADPMDVCVHGDGQCNMELARQTCNGEYENMPIGDGPPASLSLFDLIPVRNLYLIQPPVQHMSLEFGYLGSIYPRSRDLFHNEVFTLSFSCSEGVKVGHLLVALAKYHAERRFMKKEAGYVFDDQHIVHVDLQQGVMPTYTKERFEWEERMDEVEAADLKFKVRKISGGDTGNSSDKEEIIAISEREGLLRIGLDWMVNFLRGLDVLHLYGIDDLDDL